ncbi:MAG: hypothetical protein FD173_2314 [Gallionellaceae bacterium]|nr:MAG: hypothetical protein FD173_2314 [Gallionellaceae bacterium]
MAVSNINSSSQPASVSSVSSTSPAAQPNRSKPSVDRQEATVVTLSAQARRLSLSQDTTAPSQTHTNQAQAANRLDMAVTEKVISKAKEAAESPEAQLREPETQPQKSEIKGRVNTYA